MYKYSIYTVMVGDLSSFDKEVSFSASTHALGGGARQQCV